MRCAGKTQDRYMQRKTSEEDKEFLQKFLKLKIKRKEKETNKQKTPQKIEDKWLCQEGMKKRKLEFKYYSCKVSRGCCSSFLIRG